MTTDSQTKSLTPLQQLDHVRQCVHGVLETIRATHGRGNSTTLIRGIRSQDRDMALVVGTHALGEAFLQSANYQVPVVCLDHLQNILQVEPLVGVVFDNSAIEKILLDVSRSITNVLDMGLPNPNTEQATNEPKNEQTRLLQRQLMEAMGTIASITIEANEVFAQLTEKIEEQTHVMHLLDEQVQVLTRALGDSQDRIAELTAR